MVLAHSIRRPRALKLRPSGVISVVWIVFSLLCTSVLDAQIPRPVPGYDIGPKDLLEVKVFEVPELNVELRVSEDGTIDLPLIGDVHVEGRQGTFTEKRLVQ